MMIPLSLLPKKELETLDKILLFGTSFAEKNVGTAKMVQCDGL